MEACPIVEDESYILELEREVQSTKAIVNCLPSMRASRSSQLLVERDESSDYSQGELITDKPGSVTAQLFGHLLGVIRGCYNASVL